MSSGPVERGSERKVATIFPQASRTISGYKSVAGANGHLALSVPVVHRFSEEKKRLGKVGIAK